MTDPLHYLSVDNAVTAVAFGRFADAMSLLAVGESFGTLTVWDTRSWRCVRKIAGTSGGILWLHFIGDGKLIVQVRWAVLDGWGFSSLYDVMNMNDV